jgi:hypothetical protein
MINILSIPSSKRAIQALHGVQLLVARLSSAMITKPSTSIDVQSVKNPTVSAVDASNTKECHVHSTELTTT